MEGLFEKHAHNDTHVCPFYYHRRLAALIEVFCAVSEVYTMIVVSPQFMGHFDGDVLATSPCALVRIVVSSCLLGLAVLFLARRPWP